MIETPYTTKPVTVYPVRSARMPASLGFGRFALSFDGVDDYAVIPNSASLNPTNAITVTAWIKPVYFEGVGNEPIVDKAYTSHTEPYYQYHLGLTGYGYGTNPGTYGFQVSVGGTLYFVRSGEDTYDLDKWNFITGTYDGETLKLYRNGVLISTNEEPSGPMDTYPTDLYIAKFRNFDGYLPGTIDEVCIYNRALSEEEIRWNMLNYHNPIRNGLVLWLSMEEGAGNTVYDKSGYGNNGTIYGAVWRRVRQYELRAQAGV